jgi:lambda repressor-like predicted transcriptional regulator
MITNPIIDEKRHARIKAALSLKGSSLSDIARILDVAPTTVSIVSRGFRRSRRIEAEIANQLGIKAPELWPERYPIAAKEVHNMAL